VVDSNKAIIYIASGTKKNKWSYDMVTSTVGPGDQWKLVLKHNPITIGANSDRLYITGKSSTPINDINICPSGYGDGYGIIIMPQFGDNPKLLLMPTMGGKSGKLRNFKNWSASHELSFNPLNMPLCELPGPTPRLDWTVYFAVTD